MNLMKNVPGAPKSDIVFFGIGLALFALAAALGWMKLSYGFNFIDEGYHMTESWRLTVGDHFLHDRSIGALLYYTLFNALIFKMAPGITLLGFRHIQFFATIGALIFLGFALARVRREYWYLPLILSLFAFTGLNPTGMISNLYYQTYPHLFMILFLTFFICGLVMVSKMSRTILFLLSGVCLFGMSFSLLHTSTILAAPVILYLLSRKSMDRSYYFNIQELALILAPFFIFWAIFLSIYGQEYIINLRSSINHMLSMASHSSGSRVNVDQYTLILMGICAASLILLRLAFELKGIYGILGGCVLFSVMFFSAFATNFWHIIPKGIFDPPYYSSIFISALLIIFWLGGVWNFVSRKGFEDSDEIAAILMVPATILAVTLSMFSAIGIVSILQASIPIAVAIGILLIGHPRIRIHSTRVRFFILVLLFSPFYYNLTRFDWEFTFFDVPPSQEKVVIDKGFGMGIYTNEIYKSLNDWIYDVSNEFSKPGDFIISYVVSPMTHMIAGRRPSLDDTYISLSEVSGEFFTKSVEEMKRRQRQPKLVFVFDRMLCLLPVAGESGTYYWFEPQLDPKGTDPISEYVKKNMFLLDRFPIDNRVAILCFSDNPIDPAIRQLKKQMGEDAVSAELSGRLAVLYMKNKDYASAGEWYRKALTLSPGSVDLLNALGRTYALEGKNMDAVGIFAKVVELQPGKADAYYNLACMYSRAGRSEDAVQSLKKAMERGFRNCRLLREDQDLDSVRGTASFREILRGVCQE